MALDQNVKEQLKQYLELVEHPVVFGLSLDDSDASSKLNEFISEIVQMSDKLSTKEVDLEFTPSFSVDTENEITGIVFAGIPLGHEFSSFVLALLQVGGREPKIDEDLKKQIQQISEPLNFRTYVSLTCQNCPEVVQNLNIMAILNPHITHTFVEGGMFRDEVESKNILAVPTVYLNDEEFTSGRTSIEKILNLLGQEVVLEDLSDKGLFDLLVVGGGPASATAAIYAARKGIKTGLVSHEWGGQVEETASIENFIGTESIEGPKLMSDMRRHVQSYPIDLIDQRYVDDIKRQDDHLLLSLADGQHLKSKTAVIATGARWRNINVPGEIEFKNKGISYCVHCDGPLYKDKTVVVIGGGNSGVEAALDLSGIAKEIYVLEFDDHLKADKVLVDRLAEQSNVQVILNANTTEIQGAHSVSGIVYEDRLSGEKHQIDCQGVFILVGLVPNTEWLPENIETNAFGEIVVDKQGATNLEGVYAAGDCTDVLYKQIVTALGTGATAALSAYNDLLLKGKI